MKYTVKTLLAVSCLSLASLSMSANAQDLLTNGMKAFSKGDFVSAQDALKLANDKQPNDFRVTYWLAQTYKAQGTYGDAKDYYLKTLKLYPDFPGTIYVDLADVSVALDEHKKAIKYINKANEKGVDTDVSRQIKGLALMKRNKHKQALPLFESVEQGNSTLKQEASFFSGLTHKELRNIEAAENSFQSVISLNSESDLGALAQQQIEFQSLPQAAPEDEFVIRAGLAYQVDTNPTLNTADRSFAVANNLRGERDQSAVATLDATWRPQIQGPIGFTGSYYYYGDWHAEFERQDVSSHTFILSPSYLLGRISYSLPVNINYTEVNRDAYLREYSASPTISVPFGLNYLFQGNLQLATQQFATTPSTNQEDRDNNSYGVGANIYKFFRGQEGYWNIGFDTESARAKGDNWDNDSYRVAGRVNYPFTEKLSGFASGSFTLSDFDNRHTTFNVNRQDKTYTASIGAKYELFDGIDVTVRNTSQRSVSNIDLYDYKRNIVNVGIQKTWGF